MKTVLEADTFQNALELATKFVSIATILDYLKQIGKVKKLDKWVPNKLNEHQMTRCLETCSLRSRHKSKLFLYRIVTCEGK